MKLYELEEFNPGRYWYNVKSQLPRHIEKRSERAFAEGNAARDSLQSVEEVRARQKWARKAFVKAIGGLPESSAPLKAESRGVLQQDGFTIEKIIFQSRPGVYVTANLYVPAGISKPTAAVLFVCGHHMLAKAAPEYQTVCRYLVKAGFVVLAQDPVGQGERFSYYEKAIGQETITWGVREHDYAGQQCLFAGDSITRYFLHDAMRGIDYLQSRPEVDAKRIAVTGNSGGGTQTCMMMLGDPRIAAAAPATFVMNRQTYLYAGGCQDAEQVWPGLTRVGIDHEDFLLCMAPKPVAVLAVKYDFFPIEGTRSTVERSRRIWKLFGKDCIELYEDTSTHRYTEFLAQCCSGFLAKHLLGRTDNGEVPKNDVLEPKQLNCIESGQVRAELDNAKFVFHENRERLLALKKTKKAVKKQQDAIKWLKRSAFAFRNPTKPCVRVHAQGIFEYMRVSGLFWFSQEEMINWGILFQDFNATNCELTIALWDGGTTRISDNVESIKRLCNENRAVLVTDLSGMGGLLPNPQNNFPPLENYGLSHKIGDDLMWLGDSLAAMRVYDVSRCIDAVEELGTVKTSNVQVYCGGIDGVYGELAGAIDRRIRKITLKDALPSFEFWAGNRYYDPHNLRTYIIPGVLGHFDLPDLRKWLKAKYKS